MIQWVRVNKILEFIWLTVAAIDVHIGMDALGVLLEHEYVEFVEFVK
jgi:hypothetical protein